MNTDTQLRIEVGKTWLWAEDVERLAVGSTVELDGQADSDVTVYLNGRLVAKGQPVVVDGNLGIRVQEVVND